MATDDDNGRILKVMTHEEYDEDKWKEECGCYSPPRPKTKRKGR
jgi:hypothetical protein